MAGWVGFCLAIAWAPKASYILKKYHIYTFFSQPFIVNSACWPFFSANLIFQRLQETVYKT